MKLCKGENLRYNYNFLAKTHCGGGSGHKYSALTQGIWEQDSAKKTRKITCEMKKNERACVFFVLFFFYLSANDKIGIKCN